MAKVKAVVHNNSSLQKSKSFDNYLEIEKGDMTIYELTVKDEIEGALDASEWREIFFYTQSQLKPDRTYYFQNDDEFNTYSFIGGPWIGIEKLYGINGAFKVKSVTDTTLDIEIIGDLKADLLRADTIEHVTIISNTVLNFKN